MILTNLAVLATVALGAIAQGAAHSAKLHGHEAADCDPAQRIIAASELINAAERGMSVLVDCVTVEGNLELSRLGTVSVPLVITNSRIDGKIISQYVHFER